MTTLPPLLWFLCHDVRPGLLDDVYALLLRLTLHHIVGLAVGESSPLPPRPCISLVTFGWGGGSGADDFLLAVACGTGADGNPSRGKKGEGKGRARGMFMYPGMVA